MEGRKWLLRCRDLCRDRNFHDALSLVYALHCDGASVPLEIFYILLQNTRDLVTGLAIHQCVVRCGLESNAFLGCHLIRFYSDCQQLNEANKVFSLLDHHTVYTWSAIIFAHVKLGHSQSAIALYYRMLRNRINPTEYMLVSVLNACAECLSLSHGKIIHLHALEWGLDSNLYVGNALIDMYVKCRKLDPACRIFVRLPSRSVITWNSLMVGYINDGLINYAVQLFIIMHQQNIQLNDVSFSNILKACSLADDIYFGLQIHGYYTECGHQMNSHVGNSLINMYAKYGYFDDAWAIFNALLDRTVVTWNAIIAGYSQHGHSIEVLQLLQRMQDEYWQPNAVTFVCAIKACSSLLALEDGEVLYGSLVETSCESDVFISNSLIGLYADCGRITDAVNIFYDLPERSVATWNIMIGAFVLKGCNQEAFHFFENMLNDLQPNSTTFISVLKACCSPSVLQEGRKVHAIIIEYESKLELDVGICLLVMYVKCWTLPDSYAIFNNLSKQNLVTWNAMIIAYAQDGCFQDAFRLFNGLQQLGLKPNNVTYIGMLRACCSRTVGESQGKIIHAHIIESNCAIDISLGNALVDMYIECGSLENAKDVVASQPTEPVRMQDALLLAQALSGDNVCHRHSEVTLLAGLELDEGTLISVLSACKGFGLVEQDCSYFKNMWGNFGVFPMLEHYGCVGDLLGSAGRINEAEDVLRTMPFPSNTVTSTSLLTHCKMHGKMDVGQHGFNHLLRKETRDSMISKLAEDVI